MKTQVILFSLALLLLTACNNAFYDEHSSIDKEGWNIDEDLRFNVEITDTVTPYDFFIDVRNDKNYAYSNLFLFITTTFPDNVVRRDTLECPLADPFGKWYGHQTNHNVDGRYQLHSRVIFPLKGTYTFQVNHAMRDTVLCGIRNIGLHVEKVQQTTH